MKNAACLEHLNPEHKTKMPTEIQVSKTDGLLILGKRGSGKTYLLSYLVKKSPYRWLIVDPVASVRRTGMLAGVGGGGRARRRVAVVEPDILDADLVDSSIRKAFGMGLNVAVDELSEFPYSKYGSIRELVMRARNYGVGWIGVSRATSELHKSIINNADYVFVFRSFEPRFVEYLREYTDVSVEELRGAPRYAFLIIREGDVIRKNGKAVYFRC